MASEENLGIGSVEVKLIPSLPKLTTKDRYNFDISAWDWEIIQKNPIRTPEYVQAINDGGRRGLGAIHPEKRIYHLYNLLKVDEADIQVDGNKTTWVPLNKGSEAKSIIATQLIDVNESLFGGQDASTTKKNVQAVTHNGPNWQTISAPAKADQLNVGSAGDDSNDAPQEESEVITWVEQTQVRGGLWWWIEGGEISQDYPFFITILRKASAPSRQFPTSFVVTWGLNAGSGGGGKSGSKFDLWIGENSKPSIFDYGRLDENNFPQGRAFDIDLSTILESQKEIQVGVMVMGWRLVVHVNNVTMVYARTLDDSNEDDTYKIAPLSYAGGPLAVYGSNCQAAVRFNPMQFPKQAWFCFALPAIETAGGGGNVTNWSGYNADGSLGGNIAKLLSDGSRVLSGLDADAFSAGGFGSGGVPSDFEGKREYGGGKVEITGTSSKDFHLVNMYSEEDDKLYKDFSPPPINKFPVFYRFQGAAEVQKQQQSGAGADITDLLISATITTEAPNFQHVVTSATITAYNPNGTLDTVKNTQTGVEVSVGWGSAKKVLTGVVTQATSTEIAGKETLTFTVQDYMYILKSNPIINSPFYDGMEMGASLLDLSIKGGLSPFFLEDQDEQYFLPSGYSFSQPLFRFGSHEKIFDCMMKIIIKDEKYMYFDENGQGHVAGIPGGVLAKGGGPDGGGAFTKDPSAGSGGLIIEQKAETFEFNDNVNVLSIITADRDTRYPILYTRSAKAGENKLLFKRVYLRDEAALGDLESAKAWAEKNATRLFASVQSISFKTPDTNSLSPPLSIVDIDGGQYRVMGRTINFNAENNDLTVEYRCDNLSVG